MKRIILIVYLLGLLSVDAHGQLNISGDPPLPLAYGGTAAATAAAAATSLGVGTADSPSHAALTLTNTGQSFTMSGATTTYRFAAVTSTGGELRMGIDNSAGGGLFQGSAAYATLFGSNNNTEVDFGQGGNTVVRMGIGATVNNGTFIINNATIPAGYSFYVGAGTSGLNGRVYAANLTNANGQDYVCFNTSTGEIEHNVTTCNLSSLRYKNWNGPIDRDVIELLMAMEPGRYVSKNLGVPEERADHTEHFGFVAEQMASIDSRLVVYDKEGLPVGVQYELLTAPIVAGFQIQERRIRKLEADIDELKKQLNK